MASTDDVSLSEFQCSYSPDPSGVMLLEPGARSASPRQRVVVKWSAVIPAMLAVLAPLSMLCSLYDAIVFTRL